MSGPPDFVFIRGTGRCGTTMLHGLLGAHPDLVHVPVDEILPEEIIDFGRFRLGAWNAAADERVLAGAARGYVAGFCRALTGRDGPFVQKSTLRAHHLGTLLEYFPGCRIIYLVRHPIGVVESMINADLHRFRGRFGYRATVANSALRWANDVLGYLRSPASGSPRVLRVHYEALAADPEGVLAAVHRFLGVREAACPRVPPPERYARRFVLDEPERRWLLERSDHIVRRLGYDAGDFSARVPAEHAALAGDHPDRRLRAAPPSLDGVELATAALAEAARRGLEPAGFLGGGHLARLVCPHLPDPPARVAAVFDDDPLLAGRTIGGLPVHRFEDAGALGIRAAIPLSMVHQDRLVQRWRRAAGTRAAVIPLWDRAAAPLGVA